MIYKGEIDNLPTLKKTVDVLENAVKRIPIRHLMPYYPWEQVDKEFGLARTVSQYSVKPNIFHQPCLFAGFPSFDTNPIPEFNRRQSDVLFMNIQREEFNIILESHPFFRLLMDGIQFPGATRKMKIYNPFGLALSYGLPTPFIPLTSDIKIAAFNACHKYDPLENKVLPVKKGIGIIYIFDLPVPMPYIPGLSTVGKQAFRRPGAYKLFAYEVPLKANFNELPFVRGFQFKHDSDSTEYFGKLFSDGKKLFPDEALAVKVQKLLRTRNFSEAAFKRNIKDNPQDKAQDNLKRLSNSNHKMVDSLNLKFTEQELKEEWFPTAKEQWLDFWSDVSMGILNSKKEQFLLDLPDNADYSIYFKSES